MVLISKIILNQSIYRTGGKGTGGERAQDTCQKADEVWLASDEDREESISWHLAEVDLDPKTKAHFVFQ